jgi:hypothetical protein
VLCRDEGVFAERASVGSKTKRNSRYDNGRDISKPNHFRGIMGPAQAMLAFSPFGIGFEDYFGRYSCGGSGGRAMAIVGSQFMPS